jgi:hypothetical protein
VTIHGPITRTPDPDGAWYGCKLCQVTTLARSPDQERAFLHAHQVEPDPGWLERVDRARADLAHQEVPA